MKHNVNLPNESPPLDNQAMLYRVWKHFIYEGNEKCEENGDCVYRNDEGMGCVIGIVLPDDIADRLKGSIRELLKNNQSFRLQRWLENCTVEFLADLQFWHDDDDLDELAFTDLVEKHGLVAPIRAQFEPLNFLE